jgi:hypothetical protein
VFAAISNAGFTRVSVPEAISCTLDLHARSAVNGPGTARVRRVHQCSFALDVYDPL